MKKAISSLPAVLMFVGMFVCPDAFSQHLKVTFAGQGAANTVDQVVVRNLAKDTQLTLNGSDTLVLSGVVGVEHLSEPSLNLWPNPARDFINATGVPSAATDVAISTLSGQLVAEAQLQSAGFTTFSLSSLSPGPYVLTVRGKQFALRRPFVVAGDQPNSLEVNLVKTTESNEAALQHKSQKNKVEMQYTFGDLLLFTLKSGNYARLIPTVVQQDTLITAEFVNCIDGEGNHYPVVQIGNQMWMASNLKTTKYSDGTDIPTVSGNSAWVALNTGAYCWYGLNPDFKDTYGALYNWYAVNPSTNGGKHLCPEGWHVPTDAEFSQLSAFLGNIAVGGKLKEKGFSYWNPPNSGALNSTGFSALPGGYRNWSGQFESMGTYCWLWSATEQQGNFSWLRNMFHNSTSFGRGTINKHHGLSVRCIKDQ
ncbi:MAG: T9SS type A sorting domain-containing protein [Bacteroidetes bacterium]|nr:T9SS type A sorting domain-containing protein [Bacteroidota bacterium]